MVISWQTGKVLNFEILGKYCSMCAHKATTNIDQNSEEFQEWYKVHQAVCECTHIGSSGSMEQEGALKIFEQSEENLHVRYTSVISGGDSKTVAMLNEKNLMGIEKFECVGHAQKQSQMVLPIPSKC